MSKKDVEEITDAILFWLEVAAAGLAVLMTLTPKGSNKKGKKE
jgi:hypothetical protein